MEVDNHPQESDQQLWEVPAHSCLVFLHPEDGLQQAGEMLLQEREVQVTFPAFLQNTESPRYHPGKKEARKQVVGAYHLGGRFRQGALVKLLGQKMEQLFLVGRCQNLLPYSLALSVNAKTRAVVRFKPSACCHAPERGDSSKGILSKLSCSLPTFPLAQENLEGSLPEGKLEEVFSHFLQALVCQDGESEDGHVSALHCRPQGDVVEGLQQHLHLSEKRRGLLGEYKEAGLSAGGSLHLS